MKVGHCQTCGQPMITASELLNSKDLVQQTAYHLNDYKKIMTLLRTHIRS